MKQNRRRRAGVLALSLMTFLISQSLSVPCALWGSFSILPVYASAPVQDDETTNPDGSSALSEGVVSEETEEKNKVGTDQTGIQTPYPQMAPEIQADSAILMDADSGAILYGKKINTEQYPASITKILTCLVVWENCSPDEVVTFSRNAVFGIERGSSNIGIDEGEQMTIDECLYAILLESANEVAAGVAEHVAGDQASFAAMMNEKAKQLGCKNSNFVNPHGLPNDAHYTSAYDMALIARAFFSYDHLAEIAGTAYHHLNATATQKDEIDLRNHHRMLEGCQRGTKYIYPYTVGGKTGFTTIARETLVTCAEKDGKRLICVILKDEAPNHYLDTTNLFEFGFNDFSQVNAYEHMNALQIDSMITGSLGEITYSLSEEANLIVPDIAEYEDLSADVEKIPGTLKQDEETGLITGSGEIRFTYQGAYCGGIRFTYEDRSQLKPVEEETVETAETESETSEASTEKKGPNKILAGVVKVLIFIIKALGLIAAALIVTAAIVFGGRYFYEETKRRKKNKEVMERIRKRREREQSGGSRKKKNDDKKQEKTDL